MRKLTLRTQRRRVRLLEASSRRAPGIDQLDADVLEVLDIAGCNRDLAGYGNAGDLHVCRLDRPPGSATAAEPFCRRESRPAVVTQHTATKQVIQRPVDVRLQSLSPPALEELFHARPQLHDCYRGGDKRISGLNVGPGPHARVGSVPDQLGNNVCVENDHVLEGVSSKSSASKSGIFISHRELISAMPALKRWNSSSVSPESLKRSYMRSPKPFSSFRRMGPVSTAAASSRIARASASRLRPLRAARVSSRCLASSSSFRT